MGIVCGCFEGMTGQVARNTARERLAREAAAGRAAQERATRAAADAAARQAAIVRQDVEPADEGGIEFELMVETEIQLQWCLTSDASQQWDPQGSRGTLIRTWEEFEQLPEAPKPQQDLCQAHASGEQPTALPRYQHCSRQQLRAMLLQWSGGQV